MGTNIFRAVNSTLIYLERGDEYLMLHRTKKENDLNHDKWIGVGGKFEDGESPEDCALRETREETGLTLSICTSSPPTAGSARRRSATRANWHGSKRASF